MRVDVIRYEPTYLIFEAFQIIFPTASLLYTAAKLFPQVIWETTKHKRSRRFASIVAVDMKLWIYLMCVVAKCSHFVSSCMEQNKKT